MKGFIFNDQIDSWIAVAVFGVFIGIFIIGALGLSLLVSPRRKGSIKQSPYESGIEPVGLARKRINSHFYLLGLLFLLFDVELVFFYPWVRIFGSPQMTGPERLLLLAGMGIFALLLLFAYIYAWRKGVFRWPQ
jgi:NADH-quinone oxidoreductase subunit A